MADSGACDRRSECETELCRFRPPATGRLVIWEVTHRCNLECLHCCTHSGPDVTTRTDVATAPALRAARDLAEAQVAEVYFSGGEPFLRPDFVDLLSAVDTSAVRVFVATNGYALTPGVIRRLADIAIEQITVSIDGYDAQSHDRIRAREGAYRRSLGGIGRAVEAGLPIRVSGTVTPENVDRLDDYLGGLGQVGVASVVLHTVLPVGRAAENPQLLFSQPEMTAVSAAVIGAAERFSSEMAVDHSFGRSATSRAVGGCPAHQRVLHINANGDVSPCSWLYKLDADAFRLGNLGEARLPEIIARRNDTLERLRADVPDCPIPAAEQLGRRGT
ncbi:MAG: radical SAM protein [Chloroflexi bacterium]|nr:radical SAM protein [Chloroflexota bacterium]